MDGGRDERTARASECEKKKKKKNNKHAARREVDRIPSRTTRRIGTYVGGALSSPAVRAKPGKKDISPMVLSA
jgi:hypothetical protein